MTKGLALFLVMGGFLSQGCLSGLSSLSEFKSSPGSYFPLEIKSLFPAASQYELDFPHTEMAKDDVRLIAVKRLNKDLIPQNEANLAWSADGRYLSYELASGMSRSIRVKSIDQIYEKTISVTDAKKPTLTLRSTPLGPYNAGVSWAGQSHQFAFMSNNETGEFNLYLGGLGDFEREIFSSPQKEGSPTWSPIRNEVAFLSAMNGSGDIYVLDIDADKLTRVTHSPKNELFPVWTPNGNALVYSQEQESHYQIVKRKRPSPDSPFSKHTPLTQASTDFLRPTISPKGDFVAFYGRVTHGNKALWNIYVISLNEKAPLGAYDLSTKVIARNVVLDLGTGPTWSPDGSKIFYVKKDHLEYNPICAYDLGTGFRYVLRTQTKMNRDVLISSLGVLSFRAQKGAWERVYLALTNQGRQLQPMKPLHQVIYLPSLYGRVGP